MIFLILSLVIGAAMGICFFIVPLWAYRKGIRDGVSISAGKPIEPIQIQIPQVGRSKPDPPDPFVQGLSNILAYDGNSQEEGKEK